MIRRIDIRNVAKPIEVILNVGAGTTIPFTGTINRVAIASAKNDTLFGIGNETVHRLYGTTVDDDTSTAMPNQSDSSPEVENPRIQRPNRFTTIYNQMQTSCPEPIERYAKCVISAQQEPSSSKENAAGSSNNNNSGSTYQQCATEFAAVNECFRTVRRQIRQHQQQQQ